MSIPVDQFSSLGQELNAALRRNDGDSKARLLHARLDKDLNHWFYDRLFPIFDGVPESEWSDQSRFLSEFNCRNEISCFQAVEAAVVARDLALIPDKTAEWFAEWSLRLNVGLAASEAMQRRFPHYWNADAEGRRAGFCAVMASSLPETKFSYFFIVLYSPLLSMLTKATTLAAFDERARADVLSQEYERFDASLQSELNHFLSGGGTCYIHTDNGQMFISQSQGYGAVFHMWTEKTVAEETLRGASSKSEVKPINYRELGPLLVNLKGSNVEYVVIDMGSAESVVPVGEVSRLIHAKIQEVDTSEFGKSYYDAVKER